MGGDYDKMFDKVIRVIVFLLNTRCDNDRQSLSISLLSIATKTNALNYACFVEFISMSIGEVNFKTAFQEPLCRLG